MAVVTRRFERKGKGVTYLQGWGQRAAGALSVAAIAAAAVHFLHRLGVGATAKWDLIGWIIGYSG